MSSQDDFWSFYWENRLLEMENLGKKAAILATSGLIRRLASQVDHPLRLLELGCGEGQVIGVLLNAHTQLCDVRASVGVDYNPQSLARCRQDFPALQCVEGDFTDPDLLGRLGKFEVVLLVNALHEVFSAAVSQDSEESDISQAKGRVEQALGGAVGRLAPGGWLVLFDGLEPAGDPGQMLTIRFRHYLAKDNFVTFARQYHPFRISYHEWSNPLLIELSRRDFTRYITKSIFLGKHLWATERFESYQYFTEVEFRSALARQNLEISEFHTLTVNDEKWRRLVEIETPGVEFPEEHVLILGGQGDYLPHNPPAAYRIYKVYAPGMFLEEWL